MTLVATLPMSDAASMAPESVNAVDPGASAWLARFALEPDAALNDLLLGKVWLGGYAAAEVAQALPQFLPVGAVDALDGALQRWVSAQHRSEVLPEGVTAKQYAQALVDGFGLMQVLLVSRSQGSCRERVSSLWGWLQAQPSFPSREPRTAFLRAMALSQPNRDLLGFWMSLCRQGHKPWVQLALFGLRRMPRDGEGRPESSLPQALIHGLLDYGSSLARGQADATKKNEWLGELDFLSAVYPISREGWSKRFREALAARSREGQGTLRNWVYDRFPAADRQAPGGKPISPPHWDNEIRPLQDSFDKKREQVQPLLQALMDRHLHYARETGDSNFLVRSNCRLAAFLLEATGSVPRKPRDAQWAFDLGQLAATWAPSNPQTWSAVARSLDALDDWTRAQTVFWYARRRFPHNPQSHNQLGHALVMRGQITEGEAVYRAAIRRFPDNAVCWAGLGDSLRAAGRFDMALEAYRDAQQRFPRDPTICNALAAALIDLGRIDEARGALDWADHVRPHDDKNQQVLAALRHRFKALADGQPLPLKQLRPRSQHAAGGWSTLDAAAGTNIRGIDALGEATLWRQRGAQDDLHRAATALGRAAEAMRHDARWVAEEGLLLAASSGWAAGSRYFDQAAEKRPGDGVLAALRLHAHGRCGEPVDWQALRGRFEELAPLIRVAQDPTVKRPADLDAALVAVTTADGEVQLNELDDAMRQALRVYDTAAQPELADLAQQDFLAARQLSVF